MLYGSIICVPFDLGVIVNVVAFPNCVAVNDSVVNLDGTVDDTVLSSYNAIDIIRRRSFRYGIVLIPHDSRVSLDGSLDVVVVDCCMDRWVRILTTSFCRGVSFQWHIIRVDDCLTRCRTCSSCQSGHRCSGDYA